ncbi:uncharacterized protein METZ01_LOCUS127568 [marine metagenome]|uniref:Uncharacterized protein n=1 Tax=marine metagenome TaxID=408172 RepID=A0A381YCI2_9ZZZZ
MPIDSNTIIAKSMLRGDSIIFF